MSNKKKYGKIDENLKEKTMKEKLKIMKDELQRQITIVSVTATLLIHLIYLGYLTYALLSGIGVKEINIALIAGTLIFLVTYLIFRLGNKEKKQKVKTTKRFYKNFKLITKLFTSLTAIYTLYTAQDAGFFARIFAIIGAVILVLRLVGELLSFIIKRKVRTAQENRAKRREEKRNKPSENEVNEMLRTLDDTKDTEVCLLSDEDE